MISIVLVCFKTPDETVDCLNSIVRSGISVPYSIWLVNNGGDARSKEILAAWSRGRDEVFLIDTANRGFAAACNLAIESSKKRFQSDGFWLLNNDCVVFSGCLDSMWSVLKSDKTIGLVGSQIERDDGFLQCVGGGVVDPMLCIQKQYGWGCKFAAVRKLGKPFDLDFISGASMLISARVIDDIGLLNENFFLYWEETEYCYRARQAGWGLGVATSARVVHKIGASTDIKSALTEYYSTKNSVIFFRLFYGDRKSLKFSMITMIILKFFNRVRRGNLGRIPTLWSAFLAGWSVDLANFVSVSDDRNHDFKTSYK